MWIQGKGMWRWALDKINKKRKDTHERELNQESVLHDWRYGKELYEPGTK